MRGRAARHLGRDVPALLRPAREAAVQHRGVVEADGPEHPPESGGEHVVVAAVEHDERPVPDAEPAEGLGQARRVGHGEPEAAGPIGQRGNRVGEHRSRNVSRGVERLRALHPEVAPVRQHVIRDAALDQPDLRAIEAGGELRRRDQRPRPGGGHRLPRGLKKARFSSAGSSGASSAAKWPPRGSAFVAGGCRRTSLPRARVRPPWECARRADGGIGTGAGNRAVHRPGSRRRGASACSSRE